MTTLEALLRMTTTEKSVVTGDPVEVRPDFRVAVQGERDGGVHFIIHPIDANGDTLDFIAKGDDLVRL